MTTVNEKLKKFSDEIISRVEDESHQKIAQAQKENDKLLDDARRDANKEADDILTSMRKKAEAERKQIISRASIEMDHAVMIKKNDMYKTAIEDIRNMARSFANSSEYGGFLEKCVNAGVQKIGDGTFKILLRPEDIKKYGESIRTHIRGINGENIEAEIDATGEDIIGGCILQNSEHTRRVDCSLNSMINDSIDDIGKVLQQNL